jgi:hypothetical protein
MADEMRSGGVVEANWNPVNGAEMFGPSLVCCTPYASNVKAERDPENSSPCLRRL